VTSEGRRAVVPAPLATGSVVRVIAPAGPFEPPLLWRALGWLAQHYRVRYERGIFSRRGYFAGDDERRREELERALGEPEVGAIFCARGGYGSSRFVHRIDWSLLGRRPRWIVGFSDVTVLHVEAARQGVASIHGPNLTGLGRGCARTRAEMLAVLEHAERPRLLEGLQGLCSGHAEGPLFGGNLTLLHACAAADRLIVPAGAVLLVEDVGEQPYRLDRMLSSLGAAGHLARLSAVVVGELTHCDAAADGVTAADVLTELLVPLGVPVVTGMPVGHGRDNLPVVLGGHARVRAEGGRAQVELWA
jgi:muramoyltetrapeptide carboxypeptidase